MTLSLEEFSLRVAIVVGALVLVLLVWKLIDGLVLLFAATVFAVALRSLVRLLERFTPLRGLWALAVTTVVLLIALAAFFALIGGALPGKSARWRRRSPPDRASYVSTCKLRPPFRQFCASRRRYPTLPGSPSAQGYAASGTVGVLIDAVLIVFIGLFLAADPVLYRRGAPGSGPYITGQAERWSPWSLLTRLLARFNTTPTANVNIPRR